ncbi:MAG: hypothetical protein QXX17_03830 [Conexivisphaerales archaeon]
MIEMFASGDMGFLKDQSIIQKISKEYGVNLGNPADYRARNILLRVALCDFDSVSKIAGIDRKKAESLSRLINFRVKRPREFLGTNDANRLLKEILRTISLRCSSRIGANIISSLLPTTSSQEIISRQTFVRQAINVRTLLKEAGILERTKQLLANFSLEISDKRNDQVTPVEYVSERLKAVGIALEIDTLFRSSGELKQFLTTAQQKAAWQVSESFEKERKGESVDPESALNDEEMLISEELQRKRARGDDARAIIERHVASLLDVLRLNEREEIMLRRAAFASVSLPFSFDRAETSSLIRSLKERLKAEREQRMARLNQALANLVDTIDEIVVSIAKLDVSLAIAEVCEELSLEFPRIGSREGGIAFRGGRNFFLIADPSTKDKVRAINYSIGRTSLEIKAKPRNVIMLTGANSGGKTTLLLTVASIALMTALGLPVPAEESEVTPIPLYLFRRKMTRKIGSLEHALRSLSPVFGSRQRKLILMDEFEALTEPGAAGRILASIVNHIAPTSSLLLLVTHLARETLPHIKFSIRVDGIEATGLSEDGELVVERQPRFDHVGSSTPQLVIMKLLKTKKGKPREKEVYQNMLNLLEEKGEQPVQTPIYAPWLTGEE